MPVVYYFIHFLIFYPEKLKIGKKNLSAVSPTKILVQHKLDKNELSGQFKVVLFTLLFKTETLTLKEICVVPFELKLCIKIEDRTPDTVAFFSFSIGYILSKCRVGKFVIKMMADGEI